MSASAGEILDPLPPMRRIALRTARDMLREHRRLYAEARCGRLALADACKLSFLLANLGRLYETSVLEERLAALEAEAANDEPPQRHY